MKYNTKEIKVKEIINLIGNLEADGYIYIQHYFNQSYNPDDSSEINLKVIQSWMNETICRLRSLQ